MHICISFRKLMSGQTLIYSCLLGQSSSSESSSSSDESSSSSSSSSSGQEKKKAKKKSKKSHKKRTRKPPSSTSDIEIPSDEEDNKIKPKDTASTEVKEHLDSEVLSVIGDRFLEERTLAPPLHEDIVVRLEEILKQGLP